MEITWLLANGHEVVYSVSLIKNERTVEITINGVKQNFGHHVLPQKPFNKNGKQFVARIGKLALTEDIKRRIEAAYKLCTPILSNHTCPVCKGYCDGDCLAVSYTV